MKCKIKIWIYPIAVLGMLLYFTSSCKKDKNSPLETGTVTDIQGNVYQTVKIGDQWWMAENLKTTKCNDGTSIFMVTADAAWAKLTTPGYCWYENNSTTKNTYGAFYNWYAVNTGKLAPTGWHIPTDAEWTILTDYLGGADVAGGKMKPTGVKEYGTGEWRTPNTGATNESGFTAFPTGNRLFNGMFFDVYTTASWWSLSESGADSAWYRHLSAYQSSLDRYNIDKNMGFTVRCLKD
jgi:uncharacterized protein (TIGR02145 family)